MSSLARSVGVSRGHRNARLAERQPGSPLEAMLALHIRGERLPAPVREFQFHPTRKWRFDFAWPDVRLAVEVDGEVHRIKSRFHADLQKHASATLMGWTVLRVGGHQVRAGVAVQWVREALKMRGVPCE